LAKQHVVSLEAVCIGKDNEIEELKLQLEVNVLTVLALWRVSQADVSDLHLLA
jgi:hypothetical protein